MGKQLGTKLQSLHTVVEYRNGYDVELYLSEDILQGEDVPFFLVWKDIDVRKVQFDLQGFKSISRLYNVKDSDEALQRGFILNEDLKTDRYLGGVLTTQLTNNPYAEAQLEATIVLDSGESIQLAEERTLHTTLVQIAGLPKSIHLPLTKDAPLIEVELKGSTTVLIDLEMLERSEIELVLPDDVLSAVEKFAIATIEGLERLKEEFPEHTKLIDTILEVPENISLRQYFDELVSKFEEVKHDRSFMEAFAMVFVSAILGQASVKDSLLLPLTEYLESTAASKAFLRSPFLCAKVPPGGGSLSCQLVSRDLLMNECGNPLTIEMFLHSQEDTLVPVKDIVQIRRL